MNHSLIVWLLLISMPGRTHARALDQAEAWKASDAPPLQVPQMEAGRPVKPPRQTLPLDHWTKPGGSWETVKSPWSRRALFGKTHQSSFVRLTDSRDRDGRAWKILTVKQYLGYKSEVWDTTGCFYEGSGYWYRYEHYLGINGRWIYIKGGSMIAPPSLGDVSLRKDGSELIARPYRIWAKDAIKGEGESLGSLSWVERNVGRDWNHYLRFRLSPALGYGFDDVEEAVGGLTLPDGPHWFQDKAILAAAVAWAKAQPVKAETIYFGLYVRTAPIIRLETGPRECYADAGWDQRLRRWR